mmetsp:Transcript_47644/g.142341  ORF Transcript_47644/g.142341 Transcript_47644/m.142341 type:complete len:235 (-) Transcript_47644:391-1095(-)
MSGSVQPFGNWTVLLSPGREPFANRTSHRSMTSASGSSPPFAADGTAGGPSPAAPPAAPPPFAAAGRAATGRAAAGCAGGRSADLCPSTACFCRLTASFPGSEAACLFAPEASSRSAAKVASPLSTKCAIISLTEGCEESLRSSAIWQVSFAVGSCTSGSTSKYLRTNSHFRFSSSSSANRSGNSCPFPSASGTRMAQAPSGAATGTSGMKWASWKQSTRGCRQHWEGSRSKGR